MISRPVQLVIAVLVATFLLEGCAREHSSLPQRESSHTAASFDLPDSQEKTVISYAKGFDITYHNGYKKLTVLNPYQDHTDMLIYHLVPRGSEPEIPEEGAHQRTIEVPIRSMVATSTTHIALVEMLDANKILAGVTQPEYVFSSEVRSGLESGKIEGFTGSEFNKEQALELNPDLVMVSGGQASQFDHYRVLTNSGINVLVNTEWLETTPLGKAEWVKMMGALLNREEEAGQLFREVEQRYLELKESVSDLQEQPLVITNLPYRGSWFVPGGNSFTAQFLKDAGGSYPWDSDRSAGGLRVDFESAYEVGLRADIWINPGDAGTLAEIQAVDSRFSDFKAFRTGQVFNNNRRLSPSGGNDYWESGVVHPEIVLADLIKIFHPGHLVDHEPYYYRRLQ